MNLSMLYSKQNLTLNLRYLFSSLDGKSGGGGMKKMVLLKDLPVLLTNFKPQLQMW